MNDIRAAMRDAQHMRALAEFVDSLRARGLDVPDLDPNDGGINAKAVFLLESPGPKAVGTQYISADNPDPSARNMKKLLSEAGFKRSDVALWNVVPQSISTIHRNRNATFAHVRDAVPDTQAFIDLFPLLRVIVLCGRRAQRLTRYITREAFVASSEVGKKPPTLLINDSVVVLSTFHPGAQSYNRLSHRLDMQQVFKRAAECAKGTSLTDVH